MKLAKHEAANVKISITGDESEQGACLRSYSVGLSPSTHNEKVLYMVLKARREILPLFLSKAVRNQKHQMLKRLLISLQLK